MGTLKVCGILTLLLPLAGAALAGGLGRPLLRGRSHWPVILGVLGAVVCAFVLLGQVRGVDAAHGEPAAEVVTVYEWIATGAGAWFSVNFLIDPLTCVMLVTVTVVSLLVIIYSRDYMREHGHPVRGYERFFAFMGLFVFSMCALVLSGNFLLLYLGWEAVGLCSYLLIGFYYGRPSAAAAAKKAFLVNRIGDFGFGLGVLLIYLTFGTLDYQAVFGFVEHGVTGSGDVLTQGRAAAIALLLFCGAVGKSAQLPLYVWLPDAMEGPSPVSALIHAATMVTAGVYMVARCGVIFTQSETVMLIVAVVGGVTALYAATIAITQTDMKRILAYSTISQLGYMFLGLGVYAAGSAIFHLFTHAFFKALLFLAAGSVMHAMGGVIDMRRFSGLKRILPWTCLTFWVGGLALAGFPLLSGFWSKDEIIHHAFEQHAWLGMLGLVTAVLTAFYTFRMVFTAFHGEERVPQGVHAHESGKWMLVPLCLLAVGAIGAGYANVGLHAGGFLGFLEPGGSFEKFLAPALASFDAGGHAADTVGHAAEAASAAEPGGHGLMYLSAALAIVGIAFAWWLYVERRELPVRIARAVPAAYDLSYNKYYVDEGYQAGVVEPLRKGGRICFGIDEYFIDGIVWLVTAVPRLIAFFLRSFQSGSLQGYAATMAAGFAIILLWVLMTS